MATTSVGWSAVRIAAAVRSGELTARRVAVDHLEAITAREPTLRAWAHLDPDATLAAADALDADGPVDGPLAGVPVGVKDIIDVAGMPTTNGADLPIHGPAATDAACVARLRAAGAIIIGKTVTTEYALFRPGPTTNPHDAARTPGGSSSGSAAAVGAGTVPLAIGTQTAGSVVRPASFCGVVGAKPTYGAIPRAGTTLCAPSLDTIGLLGGDVAGVATGLGVMAGNLDVFTPMPGTGRVGFVRTFEWEAIDASAREAIEVGVDRLRSAGIDVVERRLPEAMRGLARAQQAVMGAETAVELAAVRAEHGALLSPQLRGYLDDCLAWEWAVAAARTHASACASALEELFDDLDVLLAPATLGEAPAADSTGDPLLCRQWTLLGTPSIAVPGLTGAAGLPLGIQTIARPGDDARALGAAAGIMSALAG
jgi:Asp-tRNA(Asn)/Glu-tRNA(Gln) amidotransferase A subunit family amidase